MENDKFLWEQFARLGEMMGDGLHYEPDGKWITREYKRLMYILCPDIKEAEAEKRKNVNKIRDQKIIQKLLTQKCLKPECGGDLKQSRSGSLVVYCQICNGRYKFSTKKS